MEMLMEILGESREIFIGFGISLLLSTLIYMTYKVTYRGVAYNKNFNCSLVMMTLVTSMIMMVIGSNIALSLGMVGALSIVRFRTAVKDSRDTVYIFWCIAVGLSCGVSIYDIAIIGTIFVALVILLFSLKVDSDEKYLLVIRGISGCEEEVYGEIFSDIKNYKIRSRNISNNNIEIIAEVKVKKGEDIIILRNLNKIRGINSVNLVSQSGEIIG